MPISDIFSKRKARSARVAPDVFQYTSVPPTLRAQVVHVLNDLFGKPDSYYVEAEHCFTGMHDGLCREYGTLNLVNEFTSTRREAVLSFVMSAKADQVLDVIELALRWGELFHDRGYGHPVHARTTPNEATEELNFRFREAGVGYEFSEGTAVRVDSVVLHDEAVKPALLLLSATAFKAANEEFMSAHDHYRHRRHPEAIADCVKAFESTLKVICAKRKWPVAANATAKPLLDAVFNNGLVPEFTESNLGALRAALESGVPTTGNKTSRHGAGTARIEVPEHLVRFVINQTASAIVFLVEAEAALP